MGHDGEHADSYASGGPEGAPTIRQHEFGASIRCLGKSHGFEQACDAGSSAMRGSNADDEFVLGVRELAGLR